jgi:hypothetical protein
VTVTSIDDFVKSLKFKDFGTPEEIAEMAKPIRNVKNRDEAKAELKKISDSGEMTSKSGLKAILPKRNIPEIVNIKQKNIPTTPEAKKKYYLAHFQAAANLDNLYKNAIEPKDFTLNPNKNNQDLKRRHYLFSPMEFEGKIFPVTITVKEFLDNIRGTKLYAIEFVDIELV